VKSFAMAVALVGATIYTGDGPPLREATIVIDGTRIERVGTKVRPPEGVKVIDAHGMVITPGFVAVSSRIGTLDIELEPTSVEGTLPPGGDPVRAALRVADTYNPAAFTVPVARAGGITSALVVPAGGQISGQAAWVDLAERDWLRRGSAALRVSLDDWGGSPAQTPQGLRSAAFLRLREALTDARLYRANRGPYLTNKLRALSISSGDLEVIDRALARELIVLVEAERASDILTVIEIAELYDLRVVIVGGAESWQVAGELARAQIPVVIDPFADLPASFATIGSRPDTAALLHKAGVRVILGDLDGPHFAHRLRQGAGNAVAQGMPYEAAIAAMTHVPAKVFGIADAGDIRAGATANLVLWNGDPLEVTTWPQRMWIRGQEVSLETRQDLLTERYRQKAP